MAPLQARRRCPARGTPLARAGLLSRGRPRLGGLDHQTRRWASPPHTPAPAVRSGARRMTQEQRAMSSDDVLAPDLARTSLLQGKRSLPGVLVNRDGFEMTDRGTPGLQDGCPRRHAEPAGFERGHGPGSEHGQPGRPVANADRRSGIRSAGSGILLGWTPRSTTSSSGVWR